MTPHLCWKCHVPIPEALLLCEDCHRRTCEANRISDEAPLNTRPPPNTRAAAPPRMPMQLHHIAVDD
jgi:hypothetical protein